MPFCLGMIADAAAAHCHEVSSKRKEKISLLILCLPFIASSRSALMNRGARLSSSRPLSAGSGEPAYDPTLTTKDGDDSNSTSTSFAGSGPSPPPTRKANLSTKTSFQLAHPPPAIKHRQRFSIRPKILLQLQQISGATRPMPVLDVLPSVVFIPKLARKFPSVFKGKDGLGADDLMVVTSQNYDSSPTQHGKLEGISEEDSWATRDVVAAICQPKKREAGMESITQICLNHGPVWEASSLPSGAYELVSIDGDGHRTVARWVPRRPITRRQSRDGRGNLDPSSAEQRKFTFSIINPNSRRHPVIATLYRSSIDISDRYSTPSSRPPHGSTSGQRPVATEGRHAHFQESETPPTTMVETDEQMRNLIVVSGIFVAFQEGYSPNFQYEKPAPSPTVASHAASSSHKLRSVSLNLPSVGCARENGLDRPQHQSGLCTRAASLRLSPTSPHTSSPTALNSSMSQRAFSTGTAFLQRANSRRPDPTRKTSQSSLNNFSNGTPGAASLGQQSKAVRKESGPLERNLQEGLPLEAAQRRTPHLVEARDPATAQPAAKPVARAPRKRRRVSSLLCCLR